MKPIMFPRRVAELAQQAPDRTFIVEVEGRRVTYQEQHDESMRWVAALSSVGVGPKHHVLTMLPTRIDAISVWLGASWLGAVDIPINLFYRGDMLRHLIEDSEARVLVTTRKFLPRFAEIDLSSTNLATVVLVDDATHLEPMAGLTVHSFTALEGEAPRDEIVEPRPSSIACIIYTSGTTGPSKGVMVSWAQIAATAKSALAPDLTSSDIFYNPLPTFHIGGRNPAVIMAYVGGSLIMRDGFSTSEFWPDVRRFGCTTTILLASMAEFLYRQPISDSDADNPMKKVMIVPLIPRTHEFRRRFDVDVMTEFNMTETSDPIVSDWNPEDLTSCGRARPGVQCRVVDEDDYEVPPGVVGELVIRTDEPWDLMVGYWKKPEATTSAWRNLWFHTGDAFRTDERGYFFFVDRIKDAIRRRGENISSSEIEMVVGQYPGILECAAVGVPSEFGEEEVKIVVVTEAGTTLDPAELLSFLIPRMPHFMVPRYVEVTAELLKTPSQKIKKTELREAGATNAWDREAAGIKIGRRA